MKQLLVKRNVFALVIVAAVAAIVSYIGPAYGQATHEAAPIFLKEIPPGYRDWKVISVAHEEGNLNSLGAILGNDLAIKAYREGTLPFPDGTIIAALHYSHTSSEENNKVFGRSQSFVPGAPTNVQFMVKDSKEYAATGGWGFGLRKWKIRRRGIHENMLSLPQPGQSSRPCLHALCALIFEN